VIDRSFLGKKSQRPRRRCLRYGRTDGCPAGCRLASRLARRLASRLARRLASRLVDWLDDWLPSAKEGVRQRLRRKLGEVRERRPRNPGLESLLAVDPVVATAFMQIDEVELPIAQAVPLRDLTHVLQDLQHIFASIQHTKHNFSGL